jgi:hypothetical protein
MWVPEGNLICTNKIIDMKVIQKADKGDGAEGDS